MASRFYQRKWRVGDLMVDERCSLAELDFLRSTYVGRAAALVEESWNSEGEEEEVVEVGEAEAEGAVERAE